MKGGFYSFSMIFTVLQVPMLARLPHTIVYAENLPCKDSKETSTLDLEI